MMKKQISLALRRRLRQKTRGSVLVESIFGVIVLLIFIFGIVELGWYYRDASTLNTFARDYARDLSTGMPSERSRTEIINNNHVSATSLLLQNGLTDASFSAYYSTDGGVTFPATQIVTDDSSGAKNSVVTGSLVMVTINYSHSRMTGLFGSGLVPMQSSSIICSLAVLPLSLFLAHMASAI
ncbi:MAG: TadE/TadG family type IV pilus assembly protein [Capsulimonas sp.]|uniref:TadE/TadG family type IV pilus assembly protein n=1 Tax=Capsulimonas sp. TaxID=2494211 RepID=UPI0032676C0A